MASSLETLGHHEWLTKTNFSFLAGSSHPHELVETISDCGYESFCVNDLDGVYGLARTHLALERLKKEGRENLPTLHYAAEIHTERDHELPLLLQKNLVLVAQSQKGYGNLCRLLSLAHQKGKTDSFLSLDELLNSEVEDLVLIQPMRGWVRWREENPKMGELKEHFKGRYYMALSRHLHIAEDYWLAPTLKSIGDYGLLPLISQDCFFHSPLQKSFNDVLQGIRTNKAVQDCQEYFFPNGERYPHFLKDIERRYRELPLYEKALEVSAELASSIDFSFNSLSYSYPQEMIPEDYTSQEYLEELTWNGLKEKFGEPLSLGLVEQVRHELYLIEELKFPDYFLTVWDIVRWARSQNILCQGRGSAANSAVCFGLGITSVNPREFDLLFERFISKERGEPPDIDVDFEHERREEVIQYIYSRYGRKRAAMVANVITFKKKGAMRAVGKALGISQDFLSRASKIQSSKMLRGKGAQVILEQLKFEEGEIDIPWKSWEWFTERLRGFPRHMGIHSGGFIIAGRPLDDLVPQEPATMEGRTVVQWCKEDIEGLGFFKIDVLALGMLTALRKSFSLLKEKSDIDLELHTIPEDDPATYQMITKADTVGVFQIESRAQMTMLPRMKPKTLYDLVIEVAIIRPGPIQGKVVHPYLRRRHGTEEVTYPDPCLEPILRRTLGIAIFQEQAMRIAVEVGDFTPGEANELRKNIGSWNVKEFEQNLDPWLIKLEQGMRHKGYGDDFVDQIIGQMRGFSDYGFPESHAISFALIAYASSYLKCHYPAAFFVGVLNSQPMGFYSPHNLLRAAKNDGVIVYPPCVMKSEWDSTLERDKSDGSLAIRMGFRLINNLSQKGAETLQRRRHDQWKSFEDFIRDCPLFRDDITALAAADAFHGFGLSRSNALWKAEAVPFKPLVDGEEKLLDWGEEGRLERVQKDFQAFNTSLVDHPARIIRQEAWSYGIDPRKIILSSRLEKMGRNLTIDVFGLVRVKQAPPSAKGMVFVTVEDETGFLNLVFTPTTYAAFHHLVEGKTFLCVNGKLQKAGSYHSILVNYVHKIEAPKAKVVSFKKGQKRYRKEGTEVRLKASSRAYH